MPHCRQDVTEDRGTLMDVLMHNNLRTLAWYCRYCQSQQPGKLVQQATEGKHNADKELQWLRWSKGTLQTRCCNGLHWSKSTLQTRCCNVYGCIGHKELVDWKPTKLGCAACISCASSCMNWMACCLNWGCFKRGVHWAQVSITYALTCMLSCLKGHSNIWVDRNKTVLCTVSMHLTTMRVAFKLWLRLQSAACYVVACDYTLPPCTDRSSLGRVCPLTLAAP